MKITIILTKEKLIILNLLLSFLDNVNFAGLDKSVKGEFALRMELRKIFIKKTLSVSETLKPFKIHLPYYVAEELFDFINEKLLDDCSRFEANFLTMLKSDLHQKLL
jgi:hypothetical protein